MSNRRQSFNSRREFLGGLTLAGAGLLSWQPESVDAEPPSETARVRLAQHADVCAATPLIVANDFLLAEGFSDLEYVKVSSGPDGFAAVAAGAADITIAAVYALIPRIEAGDPILILGGIHTGCFELFGSDRVRSVLDFKGKKIAVTKLGSGRHLLMASIVANVGLDHRKDIDWVEGSAAESMRRFVEGKIDGFLAFPPEPQELRAKRLGRVIVNTGIDRPWSQYFCCMAVANKEFVRRHPVATKRALRAILKATSLCAAEPDRAVRLRADRGYADPSGYGLQSIKELTYAKWREFDAADTVRFISLRLNEVGFIKSSPQRIISQGTDLRFLNELKKELKA